MADLIARVRRITGAGTAELTVGTVAYFSDVDVQDILDRYRHDFRTQELKPDPIRVASGSLNWLDYYSPYGDLEATTGGSVVFVVRDSTGAVQGTALYGTPDYQRGVVTFLADQRGSVRYLDARAYDVQSASADVLDTWANHLARAYDFKQGDQSFSRSQMVAALREQAKKARAGGWIGTGTMIRSDDPC